MIAKETQQNTAAKRARSLYALVLVLLLGLCLSGEFMVDPLRVYYPTDAVIYFAERGENGWQAFGMRADGSIIQMKTSGDTIIASGLRDEAQLTKALPHLAPFKNLMIAFRGRYGIIRENNQVRLAMSSKTGNTLRLSLLTREDSSLTSVSPKTLPGTLLNWSSANEPIPGKIETISGSLASGLYGRVEHPEVVLAVSKETAHQIFEQMIKLTSSTEKTFSLPDGDTIPEQVINDTPTTLKTEATQFGILTNSLDSQGPALLETTQASLIFQSTRATQESNSANFSSCDIDSLITFNPNLHLVVGRTKNELVFCLQN